MVADVTRQAIDLARKLGAAAKKMGYAADPDKHLGTMVKWESKDRADAFRNAYMDAYHA